jgi:ABC-2 type transport system ATP-binding protein
VDLRLEAVQGTPALRDASFRIGEGITWISGRDAEAGSLLLRILARIRQPDGGRIFWNGALGFPRDYRRWCGFLPDVRSGWLPDAPRVGETLDYFARIWLVNKPDRARDRELERWGLTERARDPIGELSWGQQKRLAMAVSMIMDPMVWLADEPWAGLDQQARVILQDFLVARSSGPWLSVIQDHSGESGRMPWRYYLNAEDGKVVASTG